MRWHRRPTVRVLAAAVGMAALAFSPALQGVVRDGKAQANLEPGQHAALAAGWIAQLPAAPVDCAAGFAGPFPCDGVDLAGLVTIPQLGAGTGSDVWGWYDAETEREIAIPTTVAGAAFVDVTDPTAPQVLGRMTIGQEDDRVVWRDVKVYRDHAYVVSEHPDTHLHIFDLTRLRDITSDQGLLEPDVVHDSFGSAHNIAINTDTGFAYVVGADVCAGGLHMLDLSDPKQPVEAGCYGPSDGDEDPSGDGYTHDVQCVVYDGPDLDHLGREVCFASNEDTLTIVEVTDKSNPQMLSRTGYDTAAYTHQGWLTPDSRFFVFGDELDELLGDLDQTGTYILDVTDLDAPGEVQTYLHDNTAIDHNLYIHNDRIWEANYTAGLRVMEYTAAGLSQGQLEEVGYFDVFPAGDPVVFGGAWTAYPFFPSGTIVVNSFESGMFVLTSDLNPPTEPTDEPTDEPTEDPTDEPTEDPTDDPTEDPTQDRGDRVVRTFGEDRIETAVAVSQRVFGSASAAVLARTDDFPDALAAATLAHEVQGPILLTPTGGLDERVRAELDRLGVDTVYLVGGQRALSTQVAADVAAQGWTVDRVGGSDRYETAALIADTVVELGGPVQGAIIALGNRPVGDAFPDALAASQVATRVRLPILLVTPDQVPTATAAAIGRLVPDGNRIGIAGGTAAVSQAVEDQIVGMGHPVDRADGVDRYETAAILASVALEREVDGQVAWIASGRAFPDALSAGPAAAAAGAVLLLTGPTGLPDATAAWLDSHREAIDLAVILGGSAAVSADQDADVYAHILDQE